MLLSTKILLISFGLVIIGFIGYVVYKEHQFNQLKTQLNQSVTLMEQLKDGIARSQSQTVSKDDLNAFAAQNKIDLDTIQKNLNGLNASITGINSITVSSKGTTASGLASTSTTPNPIPVASPNVSDPFGYLSNRQNLTLNEQFGQANVPIGDVGFSSWQKDPWNINILPRKYSITNVLGTDKDGKHYVYNKIAINVEGKDYPITIDDAKYEETLPNASFSFWNPRLFLGADAGINLSTLPLTATVSPNIDVGIMSYGKTKANPSLSVLQVGTAYDIVNRYPKIEIAPINLNVGNVISSSLIQNTYMGPIIGIGLNGQIDAGLGIRVGL